MNISGLLDREATVTPKTRGSWTASGGFDETSGTPTLDKCRVQPLSGSEIEEFGQLGYKATHAIYFKPGAAVTRGDTVSFADSLEPTGILKIVAVVSPSQFGVYKKVLIDHDQQAD